MMSETEARELAPRMRADGYVNVTEAHVTYEGWQVNATDPRTGERVYMPNPQVYAYHYAPEATHDGCAGSWCAQNA